MYIYNAYIQKYIYIYTYKARASITWCSSKQASNSIAQTNKTIHNYKYNNNKVVLNIFTMKYGKVNRYELTLQLLNCDFINNKTPVSDFAATVSHNNNNNNSSNNCHYNKVCK